MPWFHCDLCGDTVKKPKIAAHARRCKTKTFTCIDCSTTFDRSNVQGHTVCVTEKEKYIEGATKPGGFAAQVSLSRPLLRGDASKFDVGSDARRESDDSSACHKLCSSKKKLLKHTKNKKHLRKVQRLIARSQRGAKKNEKKLEKEIKEDKESDAREEVAVEDKESPANDKGKATADEKPRKKLSAKKRTKLQKQFGMEVLADKRRLGLKRFRRKFLGICRKQGHDVDLFDTLIETVSQ